MRQNLRTRAALILEFWHKTGARAGFVAEEGPLFDCTSAWLFRSVQRETRQILSPCYCFVTGTPFPPLLPCPVGRLRHRRLALPAAKNRDL